MNQFELTLVRRLGYNRSILIGGIDEAGRGAWAGPIVVAGVVLPADYNNPAIRDSKQLSARQRQKLLFQIVRDALIITVVFISARQIDHCGPKRLTIHAMTQIASVWQRDHQVNLVLTDAELINIQLPVQAIIHGDQQSQTIAAASIVAKTMRDRHMKIIHLWFPRFGFNRHFGYGTTYHRTMLREHGVCDVHRRSYRPIQHLRQRSWWKQ